LYKHNRGYRTLIIMSMTRSQEIIILLAILFLCGEAANPKNCTQVKCGSGNCCEDSYFGPICFDNVRYSCPVENGIHTLCGYGLSVCSGVCYDTSSYSCTAGVLSTVGAPIVAPPTPAPVPQLPTQTADVRIINNCKSSLWIEARQGPQNAPLPGQTGTSTLALSGGYVDYPIPATGLASARFWAKYGCDKQGRNCAIGDQTQYWPNPPGGCPATGCTAPIDSLLEATFGCKPGAACNVQNPTTWFDTSQVDGWTIPYKLSVAGSTEECDCNGNGCGFKGVDASQLDVSKCPSSEDLSMNGTYPSATIDGKTQSLTSVDLRFIHPTTNEILGCMSPCKKLNWQMGLTERSGSALWMCCPTPNPSHCDPSNGCVTPEQCRAGPIENTGYVKAVHTMSPGVYSYSYDDLVGLHACPAGKVIYTMEFCPTGSAPYPASNR